MEKERLDQFRRCLEKVDRLSDLDGAMAWLERALDAVLDIVGAQPPWTPEQTETLGVVGAWPTLEGLGL